MGKENMENGILESLQEYKKNFTQDKLGVNCYFLTDKDGSIYSLEHYVVTRDFMDRNVIKLNRLGYFQTKKTIVSANFTVAKGKSNLLRVNSLEVVNKPDENAGFETVVLEYIENYAKSMNLDEVRVAKTTSNVFKMLKLKKLYKANDYDTKSSVHYFVKSQENFRTIEKVNKHGMEFIKTSQSKKDSDEMAEQN